MEHQKGTVEFNDDNSISIIPDLSEEDKQLVWYNREEFERFKTEAARDACVELFHPNDTSSPSSDEQDHKAAVVTKDYSKFVVVGDFDDKVEDTSIGTDAATCNTPRKCTNEYNDIITDKGEEICRRGLGFHFSRYRKRQKAWVRSSVLNWYKSIASILLEKDPQRDVLPIDIRQHLDDERHEKSIMMLAKLCSECSKDECQSALWRGTMDYQMAYPENNYYHSFSRVASCESLRSMDPAKKRSVDDNAKQTKKRRQSLTDT